MSWVTRQETGLGDKNASWWRVSHIRRHFLHCFLLTLPSLQTHTIEMSVIMLGDSHCHLLSITLPPVLPQALVTSCSDPVVIILAHSHLASPHCCFQFNPFTVQLWLYHSLAPNLMSLLFPKGGLNPLDLYSKPSVCSPGSPCSVLSLTDPNRKHTAPSPFLRHTFRF